jgi:hypothetical protein
MSLKKKLLLVPAGLAGIVLLAAAMVVLSPLFLYDLFSGPSGEDCD